jgi:uncharacterized RDD family membrane protein YckC
MNCPSCGLLNLSTAEICVYCNVPFDSEGVSKAGEVASKKVIDLNEAKNSVAVAKNRTFLSSPSQSKTCDWREQLNLKLDRLKEKESIPSDSRERLLGEIRNREFARPSQKPNDSQKELFLNSPAVYHPLAQKTLDKLTRASQLKATGPQTPVANASQPSEAIEAESKVSVRRAKKGAAKPERVERIEINLNQGHLPFDAAEDSRFGLGERLSSGLTAAALSLRMRAGAIDALFICGCFLIFLMIIFFIPDFVFFSRSSFLGLATVAVLIANGYLFLLTALSARTLGMDHEHLRVVSFDGRFPTLQESSLRALGYFISLGCFCLGFLWGFFDPQRLTWHDRISKTLIVSKDEQV